MAHAFRCPAPLEGTNRLDTMTQERLYTVSEVAHFFGIAQQGCSSANTGWEAGWVGYPGERCRP